MDMPPELRNQIYHALFDGLRQGRLPKIQKYTLATGVRPLLNIFAVSRTIYKETHGLFFAEYFPRKRYALEGLKAVQAFRELPSGWQHFTGHALQLRSQDPDVGLEYAMTLAQVLEGGRSASQMGSMCAGHRVQTAHWIHQQPAAPISASYFKSWYQACKSLEYGAQASPNLEIQRLPDNWNKLHISRTTQHHITPYSNSPQCMHHIAMDVIIDNVGNTTWFIKGPLSRLDWSCLPKDLRVFQDKPSRGTIPNLLGHAQTFRIAKGLELKRGTVPEASAAELYASFDLQHECPGFEGCGLQA